MLTVGSRTVATAHVTAAITVAVIAVFTAPLLVTPNQVLILSDNYRLSLAAAKQAACIGGGLSGRR